MHIIVKVFLPYLTDLSTEPVANKVLSWETDISEISEE